MSSAFHRRLGEHEHELALSSVSREFAYLRACEGVDFIAASFVQASVSSFAVPGALQEV